MKSEKAVKIGETVKTEEDHKIIFQILRYLSKNI